MAFDETLAARIHKVLARKNGIEEKKIFGGIGFFLNRAVKSVGKLPAK